MRVLCFFVSLITVIFMANIGIAVEESAAPAAEPAAAPASPALDASSSTTSKGKKVSFEYTLTVDGQKIDSNVGGEPIVYTQGDGSIIPGLEKQIEGLKAGDQKSVVVEAADGYGTEDPNAIQEFPRADLPKEITPEVGMVLELQDDQGRSIPGVVAEVKEDKVKINFNHPLAGKKLNFDVKVLKVE